MNDESREIDEGEIMLDILERIVTGWLEAGVVYVSFRADGQLLPWEVPESEHSTLRELAAARGYELLDLRAIETQVRVAQFFLDYWVTEARVEGQRMIAALLSPLPGQGGAA